MSHCRHRDDRTARRPLEVTQPDQPGLRASDAEREATVELLREHGAAGRLDVEELEHRVGAAYSARTRAELTALRGDLPGAPPARPRASAPGRSREWATFLQVSALLLAIWAVSGAGYSWPAWVMVWWAFALVMKSVPRGRRRTAH